MIVVGSVSAVAVLMMVIMLFVLYFRKGKKKLPPADVIPEVNIQIRLNYMLNNDLIKSSMHITRSNNFKIP